MTDIFERNGISTMTSNDFKQPKSYYQTVVNELLKVVNERPNLPKELSTYRKYVPALIEYCETIDKLNVVLNKTINRMENDSEEKRYERWTDEEDELLIEMVCQNRSILEISTAMGRTAASIKKRFSKLVGIQRISQEVEGSFVGTLNGECVNGQISGIVTKNR